MNILDQILEYKREFVAASKRAVPIEHIKTFSQSARPTRGFARALRGTRDSQGKREPQSMLRVVAEIKRASPSKGVIRSDFDPAALARSYESGGASAISVLTDEKFFQGSLDCLVKAREAVAIPILRKEFMIDPYQIYEARWAGADAILLIAGLIPRDELAALRNLAQSLTLDVLLEIHSAEEIEDALKLSPDVLGINNRDLRSADFNTDVSRTESLIHLIPSAQTLISESGIRDHSDVRRLARMGVDGILVGEHLMREPDPGAAIHSKLGIGAAAVS
ncbi:indole-3-glycerol phosphate synthase TrpC [Candidatus Sumerlaeota bacterium]|nr:indole-3-glycerol phosphate synthase TrpC [Candidatus Sumerlaeota bacterium]MBI3735337.1 indole-3-glycerol phosphate synthase TrpC [Candidatus Sumerlaeota bacterium]